MKFISLSPGQLHTCCIGLGRTRELPRNRDTASCCTGPCSGSLKSQGQVYKTYLFSTILTADQSINY
jgi:hypothetical protein